MMVSAHELSMSGLNHTEKPVPSSLPSLLRSGVGRRHRRRVDERRKSGVNGKAGPEDAIVEAGRKVGRWRRRKINSRCKSAGDRRHSWRTQTPNEIEGSSLTEQEDAASDESRKLVRGRSRTTQYPMKVGSWSKGRTGALIADASRRLIGR